MTNTTTPPTLTHKPMTTAQAKAVEAHRADVLKSYRAFGKSRVTIKFAKGYSYNGAPVTVNIKHPGHEGVSTYSLPGVYFDALRFMVQCAGFTPAKARAEIGAEFVDLVEALPDGRESGRRLAKAFVRSLLPLALEFGHTPMVDGYTVPDAL